MITTRVMPCLLLQGSGLVKTVRFKNPTYIGDPINAVKIFNEKEVDELIILDINSTIERKTPQLQLIEEIANEAFMPVCYGGGIRSISIMKDIFRLGVEKIAVESYAVENPSFIKEAAEAFGSQSIVAAVDVKRTITGLYNVYTHGGRNKTSIDAVLHVKKLAAMGAGEILINSIDRDGTMKGYDSELLRKITAAVSIPVIACGGAGELTHFAEAIACGVSAVAAGSMFVYFGRQRGVLINYPRRDELVRYLK